MPYKTEPTRNFFFLISTKKKKKKELKKTLWGVAIHVYMEYTHWAQLNYISKEDKKTKENNKQDST